MMMTIRPQDTFSTINTHSRIVTSCRGQDRNMTIKQQQQQQNKQPVFDESFWERKPSITCWADEVEAEEEQPVVAAPTAQKIQSKANNNTQLKAVVVVEEEEEADEEEVERYQTERKQSFDEGQSSHEEDPEGELILFVGGILFTDLEKATKDAGKEKLKELKDLRVKCLIEMLEGFGKIKLLKKRWDRRYCHVIFADSADAKRAYDALTSAEEKQKLKAASQKKAQAAGLPSIVAPAKYYVRWSTKEELMGKKKGR